MSSIVSAENLKDLATGTTVIMEVPMKGMMNTWSAASYSGSTLITDGTFNLSSIDDLGAGRIGTNYISVYSTSAYVRNGLPHELTGFSTSNWNTRIREPDGLVTASTGYMNENDDGGDQDPRNWFTCSMGVLA